MRKLVSLAALLMATSVAHAGDRFSFEIGGQSVHIEAPDDCDQPSCVSVSIPGIYESGPKRPKRERPNSETAKAKPDLQKAEPKPQAEPAAPAQSRTGSLEPANGVQAPAASTSAGPPAAPIDATVATNQRNADPTPRQDPASAPAVTETPPAVVATAPVAAPVQKQQVPAAPAAVQEASPLGIWWTEEKEGKIRIEQCGPNLCGYSVNARTNQNGEKILINMKPVSNSKWSGRIYDPKSGSNYDSTIVLKGNDGLRVQGCAFGGMFCGGQTWSRVTENRAN